MCTASNSRQATGIIVVTSVLAVIGVVTVVWALLMRRGLVKDPLAEADKRIDDLERSLSRLQETFSNIVSA